MERRLPGMDGPLGQTSSAYATITDLPDELVEKIVEDLDDNASICRLSLTCKRLHFLVLPMFFSRNKLENPQNGFFHCHHPIPELLEAIRMALFVRNLSSFTFYFTSRVEEVISDISSLGGLLARIPPVGKILLGLPGIILYMSGSQGEESVERWQRQGGGGTWILDIQSHYKLGRPRPTPPPPLPPKKGNFPTSYVKNILNQAIHYIF
jgi:hypothetical protein